MIIHDFLVRMVASARNTLFLYINLLSNACVTHPCLLNSCLDSGMPRGENPDGYEDTDEEATQRYHTTQYDAAEDNFIKMKISIENGGQQRCSIEEDIFLVDRTYLPRCCYSSNHKQPSNNSSRSSPG